MDVKKREADILVSIIVPIYNGEKYLVECLNAIAAQTYENYEVIMVDDGSTDSSPVICERYARDNMNFRLIRKENGGPGSAFNRGLKDAKGQYILFSDDDDIASEDFCTTAVAAFEETGADIVCFSYKDFTSNGEYTDKGMSYPEKIITGSNTAMKMLLEGKINNAAWQKAYKREIFDNFSFPEERHIEDLPTAHILLDKADKICFIPDVLYYYRNDSSGSTMHTRSVRYDYDELLGNMERFVFLREKYPELAGSLAETIKLLITAFLKRASNEEKSGNLNEKDSRLIDDMLGKIHSFWHNHRDYLGKLTDIPHRMLFDAYCVFPKAALRLLNIYTGS